MDLNRDEANTVAEARAGSEDAWRRLVGVHQHALASLAWRMTGDAERAAEAAHEAFVRAFVNIGRLRDNAAFGAWLRTILVRLVQRSRRSRQDDRLSEALVEYRRTPDEQASGAELSQAVDAAIASLDTIYREALAIAMDGNLTSKEASELLGCSAGTYRVRVHKARSLLRKMLAEFLKD